MAEKNLKELWDNIWEGRLLLVNIASQIESGVLDSGAVSDFLGRLSGVKTGISSSSDLGKFFNIPEAASVSGGSPTEPDLTMRGPLATDICSSFLIRIAPLTKILSAVQLLSAAGEEDIGHTNTVRKRLKTCLELPRLPSDHAEHRKDEEAFERAQRVLCNFLFPRNHDVLKISGWELPEPLRGRPLAAARVLEGIGVALSKKSMEPKFFAPMVKDCPICASMPTMSGSTEGAPIEVAENGGQRVRDLLGLDWCGANYEKERTILGFFIVPVDKENDEVRRPTPFDFTSRARFRARYGSRDGQVGRMGRTADLAAIEDPEKSLRGAREVVRRAELFSEYPSTVLVGYLGSLSVGTEAYHEKVREMSDVDQAFVGRLQGSWSRDDVLNIILRGAA
ncbi:hypothetical protein [Stappia sp. ES.058]|uniref:hypothetical protein n=1 Tax=Stappia sp. ES.058 TaxID=1881061 RepID=UPI00087B83E2|nr:hypothetical protein [Stappia sp. ES.058]SDU49517.1 hypothetical protein SAMN05428979_4369 [Stappia sp. ES.058]